MDSANHSDAPVDQPDWLHGHPHVPNPEPSFRDPTITLHLPEQPPLRLSVDVLQLLPMTTITDCIIASTGHAATGPFSFGGVTLHDLVAAHLSPGQRWRYADVVSADDFGNRVLANEAANDRSTRPILLAYQIDGRPMARGEGLVRLIVPSEIDDALRQVKWVAEIRVV